MGAPEIDFEAEGLLEGLDGDEIESRRALLEELTSAGVPLEELHAAVAEARLAVLPVEHLLAGEPRYSVEEVAERSGVPAEVLTRQLRSLGVASPEPGEVSLSREDLNQAHRARSLLDSGLDADAVAELGRTIAGSMSQFAAASRQVFAETFADPSDTERQISERLVEQSEALLPLVAPTMDYVYRLHLREQLRHAALASEDLRDRQAPGAETIAVAFADLVGFTELGESVPPEELGSVAGSLEELAREVSHGPVRLVKMIGDAAMLASPDTEALAGATFELIEAMAVRGEDEENFPLLRAGIARGAVLSRRGDFYGAPVNLASRITGVARAGSVLVSDEVREQLGELYSFSNAGSKHLKGIRGTVRLYRCREIEEAEGDDDGEASTGARGRRPPRSRRSGRRRR